MKIRRIAAALAISAAALSTQACTANKCPQGQSAVYDDGEFEGCYPGNGEREEK